MPESFCLDIDDSFVTGLICAVCASPALRVHHIPNYADYVSCEACGSSFVVEDDGTRVLYGKISEEYSDTGKVVLKNWVTLSVVARLASAERERKGIVRPEVPETMELLEEEVEAVGPPEEEVEAVEPLEEEVQAVEALEEEVQAVEPLEEEVQAVEALEEELEAVEALEEEVEAVEPPEEEVQAVEGLEEEVQAVEPLEEEVEAIEPLEEEVEAVEPFVEEVRAIGPGAPTVELPREMLPDILPRIEVPEAEEAEVPSPPVEEVREAPPGEEEPAEVAEPIPAKRYRVRIKDEALYVPMSACAHCFNAPATGRITVTGSLPAGVDLVTWRRANFRLPLCEECSKKSTALSGAQKNAQLQAHLISMLVGMALFVAALGLGVVDLGGNIAVGMLLLAIIAAAGYALPLGLLLPRARRAPPLREAYLVQTTLQVREPEGDIAESYFDFRNADYANLFWESNPNSVAAAVEELEIQEGASAPDT